MLKKKTAVKISVLQNECVLLNIGKEVYPNEFKLGWWRDSPA